jgi:hypothetical protein
MLFERRGEMNPIEVAYTTYLTYGRLAALGITPKKKETLLLEKAVRMAYKDNFTRQPAKTYREFRLSLREELI